MLKPAAVLVALCVFQSSLFAGPVTYNFVNHPDLQNGFDLTGTITLDPACASACTTADIVSWEWTVNGLTVDSTSSSTNLTNPRARFVATPSALTFRYSLAADPRSRSEVSALGLGDRLGAGSLSHSALGSNRTLQRRYIGLGNPSTGPSFSWDTGLNSDLVVATAVPEPSPILTLGLVALFAGGLRYARNRFVEAGNLKKHSSSV